MNTNFKRNLLFSFGASLIILLVSAAASFLSIRSLIDSNNWVNHTQQVIYALNNGSSLVVDAQTAMRGYLLTGSSEFLDQYNVSRERAEDYFNELDSMTADNAFQRNNLRELKALRQEFYNYLALRISEKTAGAAYNPEDILRGKTTMANMRTIIKRMEVHEQSLLKGRLENARDYGTYSIILIIAAAVIALLISSVFFIRILRDYNDRAKLYRQLEEKDRETAERIRVISSIANRISEGDYDIRVNDSETDALGSVAGSLNNMAHELKRSFTSLSDNEWLQAGMARLNDVMIGEKTTEHLTRDIIEHLAVYTGSSAAVLYLLDADGLYYSAGYGYVPDEARAYIKIGEGLSGQAVASGKMLEMKAILPDDIKITYALGEVKPAHVVAIPLADSTITGVVEMASVHEYSDVEKEFMAAMGNNISTAVKAAQNRKRVQELLEETQSQSEELKAQHSELESINAELEAQTEKLQASEEELRVQQEELQQTNEELSERSVLLEEKNMEIQKKSEDLEVSTRYKSEFLANMSHELRTPLNSILLLSRLLAENNEQNMSSEQIEFARVIQSSGNGLLGLIDEILDLSKIEAGKMELELLDVPVQEVTESLRHLFTEVAKEKNIAFKIEADNAPLVIKTDKLRLDQILRNLISNAIKFTSEGSVILQVQKHPENEKLVSFIVKDTGIGIPPEKQPLIFEAFQQADGSTKRKYGGTGLGLSISRELAKLLGGKITLKSKVDEGSEFTLTLPVLGITAGRQEQSSPVYSEPEPQAADTPKAEATAEKENEYVSPVIPDEVPDDREDIKTGDKVILIVEDDTGFAKLLLDYTRKRGYKGIVTVRGDYAFNLASAFKPVGILLDIQLPVKSGWDVMEELKGSPQTKHIPVHIMSSHKVKKESLLKGAVNFLDKPVAYEQIPEIFRRIEHIVNRESQKVLIIEDNAKHAKALAFFLENHNINPEIRSEVSEGVASLQKADVDCVILDMGVPDSQAYEILENVKKNPGLENLPVIVFTGKSLSMKEELKIKKYADSIIIKTAHSYQRMLDEVSLFLHLVEEKKSGDGGRKDKINLLNNILKGKTVLVVDDDVRNIYSLTKALETLKMNVITAIDGKEALHMLEQHPDTDVVLLDMMMPNMDGYETATRIRSINKFKNLPVIAVTAKAMTGDREKCINAGASDYITKPVDVDQLLSLLRVWLYDRQ